MRNVIAAVLLVLVLVAGASVGYAAGISAEHATTTTVSVTVTSRTNTAPTTETNVTCTTSGPTDGVVLRVVANNGSWTGVSVKGEAVGYCNDQKQVTVLGPSTTNSSGWVSFLEYGLPGIYYLDVNETAWIYDLSIVTQPTTTTIAVLNLSTGNVTTHFCEFNVCR